MDQASLCSTCRICGVLDMCFKPLVMILILLVTSCYCDDLAFAPADQLIPHGHHMRMCVCLGLQVWRANVGVSNVYATAANSSR